MDVKNTPGPKGRIVSAAWKISGGFSQDIAALTQ
jgi:hypothetical protein